MTVQTFDSTPTAIASTITVTEAAALHLRAHLAAIGKAGVRLSLKEAGCTGYKYAITEVAASEAGDIEVEPAVGVKVFIDPVHIAAFKGLNIDFVSEGLNRQLVMMFPKYSKVLQYV